MGGTMRNYPQKKNGTMKGSIKTKLFALCIFLVLLTTTSISIAYYLLTRQDKHRESKQRIQIAFDIVFDGIEQQVQMYTDRFQEFLKQNIQPGWIAHYIAQEKNALGTTQFIISSLSKATDDLKNFSSLISADQLSLYGTDKRLLAVYQRHDDYEIIGGYVLSGTGKDTYLPMHDFSQLSSMHYQKQAIPDSPLPEGIPGLYEEEIPDNISARLISEGQQLGLRIIAPVYYSENKVGLLVGEVFFTSEMVERYAALSETDVNFFAGNQFSIGTLPAQMSLEEETLDLLPSWEDQVSRDASLDVTLLTFDDQGYYQGQCAIRHAGKTVGAVTVSFSQQIEQRAITKILKIVLVISGIVSVAAFGLSVFVSRKTILSISNVVDVIGVAAEGDLRKTATPMSRDEFGMLAIKLNQMITQLRTISGQVQDASFSVNSTADVILRQMENLILYMEQQATSVDNTTVSIEKIKQFIDVVAQNTTELLSSAGQILSSIQETRSSIEEVTTSTGFLTKDLHLISSSVEQVDQTVKQISENSEQLEHVAQQTETEIHRIDESLREVSLNADQTQQLAKETMEAAISGQTSVEASRQGMNELKEVVSNTARIIQEVNIWGERVSSILDIVDDIAGQTSLLSLNASIISAQAGVHGKGFAVVADEIKELAARTKNSTTEIGTLIRELQEKTKDGVKNTGEAIAKAEQGVQLSSAVKETLAAILDSATRSSNRAADTAQVIQYTVASSQAINTQINSVTNMVSNIKTAIQEQEKDIEQVVSAVENISGMSEQVSRASIEQKKASNEIADSMEQVIERFNAIADQTEELKQSSEQIVVAMHTIESTTENILHNATDLSGDTVKNLIQQSDMLQKIVKVLKVS